MLFALQIFVGKQQLTPRLAHVPLDIVGEHAQEDVRTHAAFQMMVDRADMQIDGFHRTERALDCFVPVHFGLATAAAVTVEVTFLTREGRVLKRPPGVDPLEWAGRTLIVKE